MADKSERSNKSRELSIKVDVDVSEALTGLKAVQREAKQATRALRELEDAQNNLGHTISIPTYDHKFEVPPINHLRDDSDVDLTNVPTAYLHRELVKRVGVTEYIIDAHDNGNVLYINGRNIFVEGPARIVVNRD